MNDTHFDMTDASGTDEQAIEPHFLFSSHSVGFKVNNTFGLCSVQLANELLVFLRMNHFPDSDKKTKLESVLIFCVIFVVKKTEQRNIRICIYSF